MSQQSPINQPLDARERERALDPSSSFAVTAPAGSGKTGLLTQRVLRLLQTCDHPEEVLAITFTRKAAGEMRERITQALNQAEHLACPTNPHDAKTWQLAKDVLERNKQLEWQLNQSPNRLRIQTIDGLSRQLAKQLPFDSGMGSLPEPSDQPEPLYRAAVLALFQKLESDDPIADDIALILSELDNRYDTFETLLLSLLRQRDQWLGLTLAMRNSEAKSYLENSLQSLIISELESSFEVFSQNELSLCELARYAAVNLLAEQKVDPLTELADLNQLPWDVSSGAAINQQLRLTKTLLELCLTKGKDGGWRKRLDKNMGFPPERAPDLSKKAAKAWKDRLNELIGSFAETEGLLEKFQVVRALPQANYNDSEWQLLDALTRLLPYLAAELTVVFSREGCSDFIDTAQAALTALGNFDEPSELALKLDYHIKHILIDEFQDTSVPQRRLIELLTAGWEKDDGRTLFIVGDGMQSCYGFRNAKVGIFLQARSQGIGNIKLEPLDLIVNFRSQQGVVDWVNTQFGQAFPAKDDITRGNVAYYPSQAIKPALALPGAQLTVLTKAEPSNGSASGFDQDPSLGAETDINLNRAEAAHIVALIQRLKHEAPADTVALLARTRSHLRDTLRELDLAGIRYQASELDNLAGRMAVQDLQTLLRALLDPADRISWLSLLRAPWCGLDNADLLALIQHKVEPLLADGQSAIWQQIQDYAAINGLSDAGRRVLTRTVIVLKQTLEQRGRKPLRDWLEGCWLALGGQSSLLEASDLANCQTFLDLLEAHSHGGQVRHWQTFEEAIARLYAAPATDADPSLQVMTIHKSKGLEFDQVIIPGLHKRPRADSRELLVWLDQIDAQGEQQILLSPLSNFESSDLYTYIQGEKSARTRTEATRLFYVGATRAIKQLHLFACLNQKDGELVAPTSSSLLASIWEGVKEHAKVRALQADTPTGEMPTQTRDWIRRLPADWQFAAPHSRAPLVNYRGRSQAALESASAAPLSSTPLEQGQSGDLFGDTPITPAQPPIDQAVHLNRPDLSHLHEADNRAIGTLLHSAIQAYTEANQLPTKANMSGQLAHWQISLKQASVADIAKALEKIQRALLNMADSSKGRWLLDNSHEQSACELELWGAGPKDPAGERLPKQWVIDRTFVHRGVRWVIDYKSAQPSERQSLAQFALEQTEMYLSQLQNYARLATKLGPEPVKSALYFPLCDHFEPVVTK